MIQMNKMTHDEMLKYSAELVVKNNPDEAVKLLIQLQKENEILKELNVCVGCNNNTDYKSRIDKAIKCVEKLDENKLEIGDNLLILDNYLSDLLDILRGETNE